MPRLRDAARPTIAAARLTTPATLLICTKCGYGAELRRAVKATLKATKQKRQLRAIACGCFDICPKRGAAALLARADRPARCLIIDAADVDGRFVERLLDERVRDAVPNEDRFLPGRLDLDLVDLVDLNDSGRLDSLRRER